MTAMTGVMQLLPLHRASTPGVLGVNLALGKPLLCSWFTPLPGEFSFVFFVFLKVAHNCKSAVNLKNDYKEGSKWLAALSVSKHGWFCRVLLDSPTYPTVFPLSTAASAVWAQGGRSVTSRINDEEMR